MDRRNKRVLMIGLGGLGCPASMVLAESGVGTLVLVDDDVVSVSNLHRQTLFGEDDVGLEKTAVASRKLAALGASVEAHETRFVPENAQALLEGIDLIVEGADNLPTKFLAADAAQLAGIPIVHAGAVRWGGWALSSPAEHGPCLRCLFEDIPGGAVDNCEFAGVVGPVVGALGAIEALLALEILDGSSGGSLYRLDGLRPSLRKTTFHARRDCPHGRGEIQTLQRSRYAAP